ARFFFQAEDGIRDFHVTGVQTCALPICERRMPTVRGVSQLQSELRARRAAALPRIVAAETVHRTAVDVSSQQDTGSIEAPGVARYHQAQLEAFCCSVPDLRHGAGALAGASRSKPIALVQVQRHERLRVSLLGAIAHE